MKKYYALERNEKEADIYIFGDITSWEWLDSDVSSYTLSKELKELDAGVETINVHINSYGGEVAEGLAIYNMLKNHNAKVKTYCDGFACSIASVIFMAGDERVMSDASMLMIHNAWMMTAGNSQQLRKDADDLDKITQGSIAAYLSRINITEDKLKELLDAETWLLPDEAKEMGFATEIVTAKQSEKAAASADKVLFYMVKNAQSKPYAEINADEIADKVLERIKEFLKTEEPKAEREADPEPETEQVNQTLKFLNALMGRKDD